MRRSFFIVGFILGFGLFIAVNAYTYHVTEPPCCDLSVAIGIPFPFARTGGFFSVTRFIVLGVLADIIVGLIASMVFAWVFAKSLPSMINRFRQGVQWHIKTRSE